MELLLREFAKLLEEFLDDHLRGRVEQALAHGGDGSADVDVTFVLYLSGLALVSQIEYTGALQEAAVQRARPQPHFPLQTDDRKMLAETPAPR